MESLLARELESLGGRQIRPLTSGVSFVGELATAYRVCLWSRLASRVILPLERLPCPDAATLLEAVTAIPWEDHLSPTGTLAVDFHGTNERLIHTHFGAQKVKDGIVDRLRRLTGQRPSVDLDRPDLRVNVRLRGDSARIGLDLAGMSLHQRGYRQAAVAAPLKEHLAAAMLTLAEWPELASRGLALLDPMCGSGTLLIEAALMAGDIAPGWRRTYFGFLGWRQHQPTLWQELLAEARERAAAGFANIPPLFGWDLDPAAIRATTTNLRQAGLESKVELNQLDLRQPMDPEAMTLPPLGVIAVNPPYGERIGDWAALSPLYRTLGRRIATLQPQRAVVLTSHDELGQAVGLPETGKHALYNGAIPCRLWIYDRPRPVAAPPTLATARPPDDELLNRLRKTLKQTQSWARREEIHCYRLYDADLPQYAAAVDLYHQWVHVQEYQPPPEINPEHAEARLATLLNALTTLLDLTPDQLFLKRRMRQREGRQYGKLDETGSEHLVTENQLQFLVNFNDFLDTGLFLDHRLTRRLIGNLAAGKRFLNLFGYTGSATVYAAAFGATDTVTVDLNPGYLAWAGRNLAQNRLAGPRHQLVQADCLEWLDEASRSSRRFDLIFMDPPTFSNSKRMKDCFEVQKDHPRLILHAIQCLAPGGTLIFSTHFRQFQLQIDALPADLVILDLTKATLPHDFRRTPKIHSCFQITPRP